jgi:hypothetical protein
LAANSTAQALPLSLPTLLLATAPLLLLLLLLLLSSPLCWAASLLLVTAMPLLPLLLRPTTVFRNHRASCSSPGSVPVLQQQAGGHGDEQAGRQAGLAQTCH